MCLQYVMSNLFTSKLPTGEGIRRNLLCEWLRKLGVQPPFAEKALNLDDEKATARRHRTWRSTSWPRSHHETPTRPPPKNSGNSSLTFKIMALSGRGSTDRNSTRRSMAQYSSPKLQPIIELLHILFTNPNGMMRVVLFGFSFISFTFFFSKSYTFFFKKIKHNLAREMEKNAIYK